MVGREPTDVFDPFAVLTTLARERVSHVVIGGFARVLQGTAEVTRGLDLTPSLHPTNVSNLVRALDHLDATTSDGQALSPDLFEREPFLVLSTSAGELKIVSGPEGTRGYDDLRRHATAEFLGPGLRVQVASPGDLARMLGVLSREGDLEQLVRLRRLMELERQMTRGRGISMER